MIFFIFGVAQNFWLNGGRFMTQKKGGRPFIDGVGGKHGASSIPTPLHLRWKVKKSIPPSEAGSPLIFFRAAHASVTFH